MARLSTPTGSRPTAAPGRSRAPPAGSPPGIHGNFTIGGELIPVAASVATSDTALLGFGIESLATPAEQAAVLGRVLKPLLRH